MTYFQAFLLALVEGLTEFLPISSTGHMVITSWLMGISGAPIAKIFEVNIQFGAILSVVVLYWKRFFQNLDFYVKLFTAFVPAALIGFLLGDYIDLWLENIFIVAISILAGGIVLVFIDKLLPGTGDETQPVKIPTALTVGLFQCIALIPGISRSAATIIGGMSAGLNRKNAAEFSFFLAVPTMFAAASYKLLKGFDQIQSSDLNLLLFGNVVAFLVALVAVRFFIRFLTRYGFAVFGYYRIALGLLLLGLASLGYDVKL